MSHEDFEALVDLIETLAAIRDASSAYMRDAPRQEGGNFEIQEA